MLAGPSALEWAEDMVDGSANCTEALSYLSEDYTPSALISEYEQELGFVQNLVYYEVDVVRLWILSIQSAKGLFPDSSNPQVVLGKSFG